MKNEPGDATRLTFETEGSQDNAATRGAPMHVAREVLSEVSAASLSKEGAACHSRGSAEF